MSSSRPQKATKAEGHKSRSNKTASVSSDLGTVISFIGRLYLYLAEGLVLG